MPSSIASRRSFPASQLNVAKRFALLREAVSGTMSSFYMARDLRTGKVVGLKILDPAKTAAFESRFKGLRKPCEGEIAMQLQASLHRRYVRVRTDRPKGRSTW